MASPFPTDDVISNLFETLDPAGTSIDFETRKTLRNTLPNVEYFGYRFGSRNLACPAYTEAPDGFGCFEVFKVFVLNVPELKTQVVEALDSMRLEGCSTASLSSYGDIVTERNITITARASGRKNACGDLPFGGDWSFKIADGEGSFVGTISLQVTPSVMTSVVQPDGSILYEPTPGDIETSFASDIRWEKSKLFGLIDLDDVKFLSALTGIFGNVFGGGLVFVGVDSIEKEFSEVIRRLKRLGESGIEAVSLATEQDLIGSIDVSEIPIFFQLVRDGTEFLPSRKGFQENRYRVVVTQRAYWLDTEDLFIRYFNEKIREIDIIRSYQQPPRSYSFQEGDTLLDVLKSHYKLDSTVEAEPYAYTVMEFNSELGDLNRIQLDTEIILPQLYRFVDRRLNRFDAGQSLWDFCNPEKTGMPWQVSSLSLPRGSSDPDIVYPGQIRLSCFE